MSVTKKIIIFIFSILILSCSDDSESIAVDVESEILVGSWEITGITQDGTLATEVEGVPIKADFSAYGENIEADIVIDDNPNSFSSSGSFVNVITVKILLQSVTRKTPIQLNDFLKQGTWVNNGGVISLSQNNATQEIKVIESTSTTLTLEMEIEFDVDTQDFSGTADTTMEITLEKR